MTLRRLVSFHPWHIPWCRGRILATWLAACLLVAPAAAQPTASTDSTAADSTDRSLLFLPSVFYTPETKLAGGLVLGYFTKLDTSSPTSSIQVAAIYTQRHQFYAELQPEGYWGEGRWRLIGAVLASQYPDVFYGIGPSTSAALEEEYTSRLFDVDMQLQREVRPGWHVGPRVVVRFEDVTEVAEGGLLATRTVPGQNGGTTVGLGVVSTWDKRDNLYFPRRGRYLEVSGLVHAGRLGSDFEFGKLIVDARQYVAVWDSHVVALNGYVEAVSDTAPFQRLPMLGGDDLMRGYREGRFRDNLFAALQVGYRFPLFWRFKGAVFGNVGNVASRIDRFGRTRLKYAAGAGLRFRVNDEGVHGRIDYAISPDGGALYVTLLEAF